MRRDAEGRVAELVLDRIEAMNALSTALAGQLSAACDALAADRRTRAVVLCSSHPRAFSVGADLKERDGVDDAELARQRTLLRAAFNGVLALPMPVVAAVHGFALGGGLELALSCDLIIADPSAVLGLPEVSVGVIPGGGGTQLLPRRVGLAKAAELIFTARRVTATEALGLGLIDRLASPDRVRAEARELAETIAANSPVGLRAAKHALRAGFGLGLEDGLEVEDAAWRTVAFSPDRLEGVRAFREKRPPRWPDSPG